MAKECVAGALSHLAALPKRNISLDFAKKLYYD
jgi:hypothetical protein